MNYAVGDTVVHWTHGLGTVVAIDEKLLAGITQEYYVIEAKLFKFWVPVNEANQGSIRRPMGRKQFCSLFDILRSRGNGLPEHPYKRRLELRNRVQRWTLDELCHVIRDLKDYSRHHRLNEHDSGVFLQAKDHLLDEWVLSLGSPRSHAIDELDQYLMEDLPGSEQAVPVT